MGVMYLLYSTASGFGLFERTKSEEIGVELPEVQKCVTDLSRFSKIMKFKCECGRSRDTRGRDTRGQRLGR